MHGSERRAPSAMATGEGGATTLWTAAEAARQIGVAQQTALRIAKRHVGDGVTRIGHYLVADARWWKEHLARHKRPRLSHEAVMEQLRAGWSVPQIAFTAGTSTDAVYTHLSRAGISLREDARRRRAVAFRMVLERSGTALSARDRYIAERLAAGDSLTAVGTALGLSRERVRQLAVRMLRRPARASKDGRL